ncbi:ribosomal protein L29 [Moesziomyces antarcticus]|uniref:ribosomal protein L29 n=1 Tax=Pseudozyma antarctica TaxID=84753 RepID=UPI00071980C2|nr:ribosomal protein L29 [Moesziomyces antarcticus]GAK61895.1 ribosomal protein L29 [Moesziomyces antarcticus]
MWPTAWKMCTQFYHVPQNRPRPSFEVSDPRLGVRAAAAFEAEALILRIRRPDETAAVGLRDADSGRGRHHRLLPTSTSSRPITIPPYISVKMSERRLDLALHSMTSMEPTMLIQHRYAPTYMAKCSSASCGTEGVAVIAPTAQHERNRCDAAAHYYLLGANQSPKTRTYLKVVKTFELQSKSKGDLTKQLEELKTELLNLRVQKVAGGSSSKILRINSLRKDIARVLTVMNQKQRANLREFYKGKKYIPLDLRAKKTRAIRRKLNQHERTRITERQHKREVHFANRKFVLKA